MKVYVYIYPSRLVASYEFEKTIQQSHKGYKGINREEMKIYYDNDDIVVWYMPEDQLEKVIGIDIYGFFISTLCRKQKETHENINYERGQF